MGLIFQFFRNSNNKIKKAIEEAHFALRAGIEPKKIEGGTFLTYLMRNRLGDPLAVFKPFIHHHDECIKEYAAYLLDHKNFAKVPDTTITLFCHSVFKGLKEGSYQLFCTGKSVEDGDCPSINAETVRRIALLDIRLLNIDRNTNNFVVCKNGALVPIDHNLTLNNFLGECFFAWSDWKMSQTPFSQEEKKYVSRLNPLKDRKLLLKLGIDAKAANLSFFASIALQIGVEMGFTANQLSYFFERRKIRKENRGDGWTVPMICDMIKDSGYLDNCNFNSSILDFVNVVKKAFTYAKQEFKKLQIE